jgi:5-methylcytosine-specific restriction endonuclease McrA
VAERTCRQCGQSIPSERFSQAVYCSDACKWRHRDAARHPRYRGPRPCQWCGEQFTPREGERPHVTYCSDYCRNKRNAIDNAEQRAIGKANWRHSRRAQFAGAYITVKQWAELVDRHEGRCAYCGASPKVLTQDRTVPVIRGGAHSIDNIVPACQPCNSSKGDKLLDEWKLTAGYARCMARVSPSYMVHLRATQ